MAKTKDDLGVRGHLHGDADGFGPFRGFASAIKFELAAIVVFGAFLFWFWS